MYSSRCTGPQFQAFEKKYNIRLYYEEYYSDITTAYTVKRYKIVTADGNKWANGLSYRDLLKTLRRDGETLKGLA